MVCSQFKLSPIAAIISLSALTSFSVLADDAKVQEESIERISVYGASYRNTATKSKLSPIETPQSIKVIDQKELQMRGADSIIKAMRYVSGVTTEPRGGVISRLDEYTIRGFKNYNNYWDGLILPWNGWNIQPQIDAFSLNSIEVLKGPSSVLYGNAAPGGMINLAPKEPQQESQHTLQVRTGNRNLREFGVDSTGQIGDSDFSYRVTSLYHERDSQAATSENQRYFLAPSLTWQINDATHLKVYGYFQKDPKSGAYSSLPSEGTFLFNPNGELPVDTYIGDKNFDTFDRDMSLIGYKVSHQLNDSWSIMQHARYLYAEAITENIYNRGFAKNSKRLLNRAAYRNDESTKSFVIDNQISATLEQGVIEHNLLFGLDYQNNKFDKRWDHALLVSEKPQIPFESIPNLDLFARNNDQLSGRSFIRINQTLESVDYSQVGYYFQDQLKVNDFVGIFGLRYDKVQQNIEGRQLDYNAVLASGQVKPEFYTPSQESTDQDNLSIRFGALYTFDNGLAPFASYAEGFESVSGLNSEGNAFKPLTSAQTELGLKFTSENKEHTVTVAWFDIDKKNIVTTNPKTRTRRQTGLVNSQGLELESEISSLDNLLLTFSYSYMDVKVEKDDNPALVGKSPTWVADENAMAWVDYHFSNNFLEGLNVGTGVRYVGNSQVDDLNTREVPSFTLYDFAASYDFGSKIPSLSGMSLTLSVTNLTDERYVSSCYDSDSCWFGAERSIEAGVRYEF
ncbi:TonB-dependent siderophore receptor [Algicola sagamiensis]|uniref:TonB-dependent siderophore receptor n=1 Tax=Algicola sagamiensis TaxID=163869 RepID=UPI0003706CF1|nr:TonB-dependent siderophore receptor [Algicola sagamiensis]